MSFTLTDYQTRTLRTMSVSDSPVLVFIPVTRDLTARERTADQKRQLDELVTAGLLSNDTENMLKENAIAKGFAAYTLTAQSLGTFWGTSAVTH